jgi:metal-responsive CopG/Arc/MetJ family transcriptional regulator
MHREQQGMTEKQEKFDKRLPTTQVSQEMLDELKACKDETGNDYSFIIRNAVKQYLARYKKSKQKKESNE